MNYLLDTNIVIYFLGKIILSDLALKHIDNICSQGQHLSVITKLELLGYRFESAVTEEATQKFVGTSLIYQLNSDIENEIITIRKSIKIKLPDAIIAATAIVHDLTLISANTKDFQNISDLKILNPMKL